jgi:hypothetical protein
VRQISRIDALCYVYSHLWYCYHAITCHFHLHFHLHFLHLDPQVDTSELDELVEDCNSTGAKKAVIGQGLLCKDENC